MSLVLRRRLVAVIVAAVSIVALAPAAGSQPLSEQFTFAYPAWSHDGKGSPSSAGSTKTTSTCS